jgi:hypothetical protein
VPSERTFCPFEEPLQPLKFSCHCSPIDLNSVGTSVDHGYVAVNAGEDRMEIVREFGELRRRKVRNRRFSEERHKVICEMQPQRA